MFLKIKLLVNDNYSRIDDEAQTLSIFTINCCKERVVIFLKFEDLFKPNDDIKVISKESKRKKSRERDGKVISVNERFLTVNLGKYTESLDIYKVNQGLIKVSKVDYA